VSVSPALTGKIIVIVISGNIFGGTTSKPTSSGSIFGSSSGSESKSNNIFGGASGTTIDKTSKPSASGSIFGAGPGGESHSKNIFGGQSATDSKNIFQSSRSSSANIFDTENRQTIFADVNSGSIFTGSTSGNALENLEVLESYSKLEDLSEEDIESFKAPIFKPGKIPLVPPAECFCK